MAVKSRKSGPYSLKAKTQKPNILRRIFPFLRWFDKYSASHFRIDLISGVTVALVLIPQSMAYAQLAGLPAYYGLYAAFLPPIIAAMFGSSNQLATGPVAVVSLMTATALEPLATAGSESYIAYAIMLALVIGIFQLSLGMLRLGMVVNFLSHPVVNGFTNAAAIIIATSQLSKLFGVDVDKAEHHYETIYNVIVAAFHFTHWPTLALAALAFIIMAGLKRLNRKIPNVLIAVVVTTIISLLIGFEKNYKAEIFRIKSPEIVDIINRFNAKLDGIEETTGEKIEIKDRMREAEKAHGSHSEEAMNLSHQANILDLEITELKEECGILKAELRAFKFQAVEEPDGEKIFFHAGQVPPEYESISGKWRLKVGNKRLDMANITMVGGGAVVGNIPSGLPSITVPKINLNVMIDLLTMAVIISILGFMEAISIAKAMCAKTGQRLDPNQELIGQGLANIVGSFGQSYPVSGSFSRSAVNLQAGAVTGLSSAFSTLVVVITLLLFTPLLYHLPQSVLAAIIMMAVIGLVNVKGFVHAWQAQKYDGAISIVTFVTTLTFAPHLDKGIMIGVTLSIVIYLLRNIKPDMALLSKYTDGTYRNADRWGLQKCDHIAVVRFNNSLFFANVQYLEDKILEQVAERPKLKHIHIVGNGINELDASGESTLALLVERLRDAGYDISFSGLNDSVLDVMRRTHLLDKIGEGQIFGNVALAVNNLYKKTHPDTPESECPLMEVHLRGLPISSAVMKSLQEKQAKPSTEKA